MNLVVFIHTFEEEEKPYSFFIVPSTNFLTKSSKIITMYNLLTKFSNNFMQHFVYIGILNDPLHF